MSLRSTLLLACAGLCLARSVPACAEEMTADDEHNAELYIWDNALFTLYHEIGHMLIDLYKLPVFAKEEDGVDNLATLMALQDNQKDKDDPIVLDAIYGWVAAMRSRDVSTMKTTDFFDEHSIDAQRAFQMICVLVGSDKAQYGEIATTFGLDDRRQDRCAGEYEQTVSGWNAALAPHRIANDGEPKVSVKYEEPGEATRKAHDVLVEKEVLESVATMLDATYTLPVSILIEAKDCGEQNAFYSSGRQTITLCYEYIQNYYDQYVRDIGNGIDPESADYAAVKEAEAEAVSGEAATSDDASDEDAAEDASTESGEDDASE